MYDPVSDEESVLTVSREVGLNAKLGLGKEPTVIIIFNVCVYVDSKCLLAKILARNIL